MPLLHTIQQGEHLSAIAKRYGFENFETIWNDKDNKELRRRRENPNALLPGDEVVVPDKAERVFSRRTMRQHPFTVHTHRLKFKLRLVDLFGDPVANSECTIEVDGEQLDRTTDGDGRLEVPARRSTTSVKVTAVDHALCYDLAVGHLDPVAEPPGVRKRLSNLGYHVGPGDQPQAMQDVWMAHAIEFFQDDEDLTVDRERSEELVAQLRERHGC